jgi:hypothetical protein
MSEDLVLKLEPSTAKCVSTYKLTGSSHNVVASDGASEKTGEILIKAIIVIRG